MSLNFKVLDLFSGIGGFSLAAHWLGWQTVAFVEKDEFCQKVLRKNFEDIPIYDDIITFSGESFRRKIDIITGGFPCQPFSQAGKQLGASDERYLFPEMLRVIREVEPTYVVAENVRGLLGIESGNTYEEICSSLENLGYEVQSFIIPACAVNAPHRRDRVWIIAHADRQSESNVAVDGDARCGKLGQFASDSASEQDDRKRRNRQRGRLGMGRNIETAFCDNGQADYDGFSGQDSAFVTDSAPLQRKAVERRESNGNHQCDSVVPDADPSGLPLAGFEPGQQAVSAENGIEYGFGNFTDPERERLFGERRREKKLEAVAMRQTENDRHSITERHSNPEWSRNWFEIATELCRMDDGLPAELDESERRAVYNAVGYFGWQEVSRKIGVDCSKVENSIKRVDRLRSLGNAIVPSIAFEIFQAIEQAEKE